MTVRLLDFGHRTVREAEHWLATLPPVPGLVACTHLVTGDPPHVTISLAANELPVIVGAVETDNQTAGRAVIYPGVEQLTGTMTVADLLATSAIDQVKVIGGAPATPDTLIDTRDFVRPQWIDAHLTLVATPAPNNHIAPFEVPNPTPCCADHPLNK
jgi:hypothetical protein